MTVKCNACGSTNNRKEGRTQYGKQKYKCRDCGKQGTSFTESGAEPKNNTMVNNKDDIQFSMQDRKPLTEDDILSRHNITFKVFIGAKSIPEHGKDGKMVFWEEQDFVGVICKLKPGASNIRKALDDPTLQKFHGKSVGVNNKTYWGHPNNIAKMKEQVTLE